MKQDYLTLCDTAVGTANRFTTHRAQVAYWRSLALGTINMLDTLQNVDLDSSAVEAIKDAAQAGRDAS